MLEASQQEGPGAEEEGREASRQHSQGGVCGGWHGSGHWLQEGRVVSAHTAAGWDGSEGERLKE